MASAEAIVAAALSGVAQVFPDLAPATWVTQNPGLPWITYTSVGGQTFNTLDGTAPSVRNARMDISVFSSTRKQTLALMEQVFQLLVNPTVKAVPIGAPISTFESDTLLYSSSLDFSITYQV